jgi:hypothetical protein
VYGRLDVVRVVSEGGKRLLFDGGAVLPMERAGPPRKTNGGVKTAIEALGGLAGMDPADQVFFGDSGHLAAAGGQLKPRKRRAQDGGGARRRKRCRAVPAVFAEHCRGKFVAEEKSLHDCAASAAALARAAGRLGIPRVPLVAQDLGGLR